MPFDTPRLRLRAWTREDLASAFRLWSDPRVLRYAPQDKPLPDLEAASRLLDRAIRAQVVLGFCLWPVVLRESGLMIGACGFHRFEGGPALELAYHFMPEFWGHGYATEAARACLLHADNVLRPPRIVAATHPDNAASIRVLAKLGFADLGLLEGERWFERVMSHHFE